MDEPTLSCMKKKYIYELVYEVWHIILPYFSRGMQKWYQIRPPRLLLRVDGKDRQGHLPGPHQGGVEVRVFCCDKTFKGYFCIGRFGFKA